MNISRCLSSALLAGLIYPYPWAPGLVDPNCTKEKVCVPGYTKTVRPAASYTTGLKMVQIHDHGIDCSKGCEEDHVIPLELCGHPSDPMNLSPEPYSPVPGAHEKDKVEDLLHKQVCSGQMTLEDAQKAISHWQDYL